jgi:hypothetical protein
MKNSLKLIKQAAFPSLTTHTENKGRQVMVCIGVDSIGREYGIVCLEKRSGGKWFRFRRGIE